MISGGSAGFSTMIALPRSGAPDLDDRPRGRGGELVDVGAGARAGRARRDRGDDLGVGHRGHGGHGGDDRHRRLAAAGDHVDVGRGQVSLEVDHRDDVGPDRRRGQIDRLDAGLGVARGVGQMGAGRGRLKHDVGQLGLAQQPVDALVRGDHAGGPRPRQAIGPGIDADHPAGLNQRRARELDEQVGADVARADDRRRRPRTRTVTVT